MLRQIAPSAVNNAKKEAADIQAAIGSDFTIESWDWDFYTEKVRQAKYNLDSSAPSAQ